MSVCDALKKMTKPKITWMLSSCVLLWMPIVSTYPAVPTLYEESHHASSMYCPAHCSRDGYYKSSFTCSSSKGTPYCCGNATYIKCCNDATQKIPENLKDVCTCERSSCMFSQWHSVFGVVTAVFLVLLMNVCCCQCCMKCPCCAKPNRALRRLSNRVSNREVQSVSANISASTGFNPDDPYAFKPPDYDTVNQDLPKYEEIAGITEVETPGHDNPVMTHEDYDVPPPTSGIRITVASIEETVSPADQPPTYEVAIHSTTDQQPSLALPS
jgi:hypothetical protein